MAAESDVKQEIFNVGTGVGETINHLVDLIGGPKIYVPARGNEPYTHCADITKITTMLGWKPEVNFEQGIADAIEGYNVTQAA